MPDANEEQPKTQAHDIDLTPLTKGNLIELFSETASALPRKVDCIAARRTSLVLQAIRPFTFFVDLVFLSEDDLTSYIESMKSAGYKLQIFGRWLRFIKKVPIDLSLNRAFLITDPMLNRTTRLEENTGKLIVKLLSPQDALVLDCLSWHAGDLDDIKTIIEKTLLDWSLLLDEIKERMAMGVSRRVPLGMCYALDRLQAKGVKIPEKILEEISEILCRQDLRTSGAGVR